MGQVGRWIWVVLLVLGLLLGGIEGNLTFAKIRVGLVLDKGGKDDKSFNAAAYAGALRAQKEFGVDLKYVEAADSASIEPMHRKFADRQFDLIIGIGIAQKDGLAKIATQFKDRHFAIVDADVELPNVRTLLFQEHEGSYLVGAIAALKSQSGKVGFIGGMDVPLIRRFQLGYEAGARAINPKIQVISNFVGVTGAAWNNPPQAKALALSQYQAGADVIFAAAGASNMGLFDAAEERKKFAIGVDSNQNWIKPGYVLTSMLKRVDRAVYEVIRDAATDKFSGGVFRFGLSNEGVDYALDEHNQSLLTQEIQKRVNQLKADIVSGKVKVPDYYLKKK